MVYAIKNGDLYFAGMDYNGEPAWEDEAQAATYENRLHAETQALLLAQDDDGVRRKAVELVSPAYKFQPSNKR